MTSWGMNNDTIGTNWSPTLYILLISHDLTEKPCEKYSNFSEKRMFYGAIFSEKRSVFLAMEEDVALFLVFAPAGGLVFKLRAKIYF